jgi:hypothetical protein
MKTGGPNGGRVLPLPVHRVVTGAVDLRRPTRQKHAFTEENTYQKPFSPGLTGNLV